MVYYIRTTTKFKQGDRATGSKIAPIPSKTHYEILKVSRCVYTTAKFKINRSHRKILKASRCVQTS
ncbi:hypothetical protein [uncultured Campylobacter sp.]|uniref:hypothetical protein n=1 Tax=uncultured Campylobacter sp. TaxID=218934 RepID=UPI002621E052|nr:hypothetical protein [uncultured Campylobacter sp.]